MQKEQRMVQPKEVRTLATRGKIEVQGGMDSAAQTER